MVDFSDLLPSALEEGAEPVELSFDDLTPRRLETDSQDPYSQLATSADVREIDVDKELTRFRKGQALETAEDKSTGSGDLRAGALAAQAVIPGLRTGRGVDLVEGATGPGSITALEKEAQSFLDEADALEAELGNLEPDEATFVREQIDTLRNNARQRLALSETPYARMAQERLDSRAADGIKIITENAPKIVDLLSQSSAIPMNPSAAAFVSPDGEDNTEKLGYMWDAFANDPSGVARTFALRSLPASAPSIIAGIVGQAVAGPGGAAALAGLVGGTTEVGASISQSLTEAMAGAKVDVKDPAAVEAWTTTNMPEVLEMIGKARTRGAVIGTGSAVSAGLIGGIARGVSTSGTSARIAGTAAGTGVEGAAEGGTEALAQVASGDELNLGEVGAEVVGGTAMGLPMAAGQIAVEAARARQSTSSTVNTGDIPPDQNAALTGAPGPETGGAPAAVDPDQAAALADSQPAPTQPAPTQTPADITMQILGGAQPAPAPAPEVTPEVTPAPAPFAGPISSEEFNALSQADRERYLDEIGLPPPPAPADAALAPSPVDGSAAADPVVNAEQTPEEAGDTLETIPETPATIETQAVDLLDPKNARRAMFIPDETSTQPGFSEPSQLSNPKIGFIEVDNGTLYFNKTQANRRDILAQYNKGKLNELLGLGPFNKADVAESVAAGNPERAVTERTPDGVEVKAAAGTTETAPDQVAALEDEAGEGNTVQVEDPVQVLEGRVSAPEDTPSPAAQAAENLAEAQKAASERKAEAKARREGVGPKAAKVLEQAKARREGAPVAEKPAEAPAETSVTQQGNQNAPVETAPEAAPETNQPTKAEAAKTVSKAKGAHGGARKSTKKKGAQTLNAAADREEARRGSYDSVNERVKRGELNHVEEAAARAKVGGLSAARAEPKIERARIAGEIFDNNVPNALTPLEDKSGIPALRDRLAAAVDTAVERGFKFESEGNKKSRPGHPINANATIWLHQTRMMLGKLRRNTASLDEINLFLAAEHGLKTENNGDLLRAIRKEDGADVITDRVKKVGKDKLADSDSDGGDGSQVAETSEADTIEMALSEADVSAANPEDRMIAQEQLSGVLAQLKSRGFTMAEFTELMADNPEGANRIIAEIREQLADPAQKIEETDTAPSTVTFDADGKPIVKQAARPVVATVKRKKPLAKPASKAEAVKETSKARVAGKIAIKPKVTPEGNDDVIPMGRDSRADARGDLERNGQEADLAEQTITFAEAQERIAKVEAENPLFAVLRSFTGQQLDTQRAVSDIIFKAFKRVVGDVKIHILDDATFDRFAPNADGYYNPKGDYIAIRASVMLDPTTSLHTVLHEGSHAVFEAAMRKDKGLKRQVEALRKMAATHALATNYDMSKYGFENASEFIAEAWSNPEFQEFLASVPITAQMRQDLGIKGPETVQVKSLWHWLKARLVDLLGIKQALTSAGYNPGTKSVLEAALDVGGVLLERAPTARAEALRASPDADILPAKRTKPSPDSPAGKLMARGVPQSAAVEAGATIEKNFKDGVTDAQYDALATALKESFGTQAKAKEMKSRAQKRYTVQKAKTEIARKKAEDQVGQALEEDFVPGKNPGRPWLLKLSTNLQIAERADRFFGSKNPVRVIARAIETRRQLKTRYVNDMGAVTDKLAAAQKRHTRQQWEEFASLAHDVTTAEIHPDRSLEDNKHLGKKVLKNTWKKAQHAELSARYNRLPQDLKDLYAETRDTLTDAQNTMSLKLMENVLKKVGIDDMSVAKRLHEDKATEADRALLGDELMDHIESVAELKKLQGPYFNLARRGDFVVRGAYEVTVPGNGKLIEPNVVEFKTEKEAVAYSESQPLRNEIKSVYVDKNTGERFGIDRDGTEVRISKNDTDAEQRFRVVVQNQHVEFVDSRKEALERAADLKEAGVKVKDIEPRRFEREAPNAQMLSDQMRSLMTTMDKRESMSNLSDAQKAELRATLNEVSLRFLGSTRIQSSRLPRRYVAGASQDLVRNTFDYVDSTSSYLARLDTQPTIEDAMLEMERRVSDISSRGTGSGEGARMIANEIEKRVLDVRYQDAESALSRLTNRLTTASFVDNLMSPAYSFVNAMQVGMLTLPKLSGDFSAARASYQVTKAYADISAARVIGGGIADTVRAVGGKKAQGDRFIDDIKGRLKDKGERDMLDTLVEAGLIDADANLEIERALQRKGAAGMLIDAPLGYLENIARAMPQSVEAINRTVSAVAAYRMMYAKTRDHGRAVQYAEEVVHHTQGLYSNSNAAPIFNHPVGRLTLQFKKYPQLVYYMLGREVGRVMRPMDKGDRAAGIKTLAYVAATHGALAGVVGALPWEFLKIPLMLYSGIAEALGNEAPEWEDFEDEVEEWIAKTTGNEMVAEMLTFGAPRGLGIDLSTRTGLQNLLIFGEPRGTKESDYKTYLWDTLVGAPGRTITDVGKGMIALGNGDIDKAIEGLIPMKLVADAAKAVNGTASGKMDGSDAALRVFGLTSARQANIQRDLGADIRENRGVRDQRVRLERRWMQANTPAEIARATAAIREYNASLPKDGRKININTLRTYKRRDMERYN